jgi:hypothetical protein
MTHYAREKEQDPRQILMDHFMYNTVAHEATRTRSFGSQMLDQRFIDFTLLQLREKDCDVGDLSRDFRAAAHASNSPFPELSVLTPQEVRADLEQLASLGYARILKVGDNTYATLDTKGEARLQELGAPVVPCSTWKELSKRLYSRSSKQILKEALEDWFSMERNNRRENQWWAAIDYFLDRKFHLFREDVKGNEIVEQYFRRKYTRQKGINPIKRHAREFLNYVFDDQIELSLRP